VTVTHPAGDELAIGAAADWSAAGAAMAIAARPNATGCQVFSFMRGVSQKGCLQTGMQICEDVRRMVSYLLMLRLSCAKILRVVNPSSKKFPAIRSVDRA